MAEQLRRPSGRLANLAAWAMRRANRRPYRLAIQALDPRPADHLLELGFGPGEGLRALAARAPRGMVWGVDHSEAMLATAARRNARLIAAGQVELCAGQFDSLPLAEGSVDGVLAVNVAYFWDDADAVLREIRRVLRPGGRLSIYVTDAAVMRRWRFISSATHRLYDAATLHRLLASHFEHVRLERVQMPFGLLAIVAAAGNARAIAKREG